MAEGPHIYMDNHATTRCDPRVVEAMLPYLTEQYANAGSSNHVLGRESGAAVERARESIAAAIGASPDEVLFTSGATESNNLALRGVMQHPRRRGSRLVGVATEHDAVLEPLRDLAKGGEQTHLLGVRPHGDAEAGRIDLDELREAVTNDAALVSVMLANNEIGTIQPLREIAALCREAGVLLHTDATQAVGKIPVDVRELGVDLLSFSGHKLYGPRGIGVLYVRGGSPRVRLRPQITGGGQQQGRRSGTLNTPAIVGLAKAVELCLAEQAEEALRIAGMRDSLWSALQARIPGVELCGPALELGNTRRLPGNLYALVRGVDSESLLLKTERLAASSGATCASSHEGPSHVLLALGLPEDRARGGLRFGLGRFNTEAEVPAAADEVAAALAALGRDSA
ncbi:MAG: cysteine desulfurase family protein [Planctomycetota bacterium]